MRKDDKASISLKKVICISIVLFLLMGISVMAVNSKIKSVKIILSNGYEMDVLTTKEKVSEIVKQNGEEGICETTYKVKYQNDVEISKTEISKITTKQPVNKIIEIKNEEIVSRGSVDRANEAVAVATTSGNALAAKVQGMTPIVKTLNASAYTASTCGKSPNSSGYGVTSSGARASAWCTVAAGKSYPVGTIIYIPYFANKPNGGWFVVQDRGGAISNNKLDIYMNTYSECINFGRRNLECYIYQF